MALRRAAVQQKIEVLFGGLVLAETDSLGGRRNVDWAVELVTKFTMSEPGPGLYTIVIGDLDQTWDTSWGEERDETDTPASQERRIIEHYETLASRAMSGMFEMLRQVQTTMATRDTATTKMLAEVSTIQEKNTVAVGKLMERLGDAISRRENEPEAEADRIDSAIEAFKVWTMTNKMAIDSKTMVATTTAPTPADVAKDILSKIPAEDRAAIMATEHGPKLEAVTTAAELMGVVGDIVKMSKAGTLKLDPNTLGAAARMLKDLA